MRARLILLGSLVPAAFVLAAEPTQLAAKTPAAGLAKPTAPAATKPAAASAPKPGDPADKSVAMEGDGMMMSGAAMMGAKGASVTPAQAAFFNAKIQPILSSSCYKCHSVQEGKDKGGLTMDTKEGLKKGGDDGPVVKPGDPENSLLITAVSYKDKDLQMPPKGEKLSNKQIADLIAWVKMGAPDPRKSATPGVASKLTGLTDKARSHWAFQPVKKPAIPVVKNRAWCITPVDAFVMEKIEAKGMAPSPGLLNTGKDVDKETLLRRATFDLIGLPPTMQENAAFLQDTSPGAFAKVVERLLASPHYGERWGRFWLDTARYADTAGGDRNQMSDYRFPYAWTYRDWVVSAFNNDMPYEQFVLHQLAADLIPKNDPKNLAALGFITVGEQFGNNNDVINDRIDVVTKGFVGLTVACARCHDHMFDPIPTKDYYALHGVFSSIIEPSEQPVLKQPDPKLFKDFQEKVTAYEVADRNTYYNVVSEAAASVRAKIGPYVKAGQSDPRTSTEEALKAQDKLIQDEQLERELVNLLRGRIRNDNSVFGPLAMFKEMAPADYGAQGAKKAAEIAENRGKRFNPLVAEAFRNQQPAYFDDVLKIYQQLFSNIESKSKDAINALREATDKTKPPGADPALIELAAAPFQLEPAHELSHNRVAQLVNQLPQRLRGRGNYNFAAVNELKLTHDGAPPKAMVVADRKDPRDSAVFIRGQAETRGDVVARSFLEILTPGGRRQPFRQGSGRLELAQAIASKNNPLTARVIVNRVWMHHFGEGFVRTPDDLGTQAEQPSHPALVDYLSHYLMEQKWSLKALHKMIMLSKVYQISSDNVKKHAEIDPENRLLWRANVRRLDFEAMRDSMLVMGDKLDRTLGGQPVNLTDEPYSYRRTVYGYIDRGNLPELMQHFDFGDPHMPNSKRTSTIVPQQALFLMNSAFAVDVARAVIKRPEVRNAPDDQRRIMAMYKIILQRNPRPIEFQLAVQFIRDEYKAEPQVAAAAKELTDRATKRLEERAKREKEPNRMDGYRAIRNEGEYVVRKALTHWETFAQSLLLSNEAAYVN